MAYSHFRERSSAAYVGIAPSDVHAVSPCFTVAGNYDDHDTYSPLCRSGAKLEVVKRVASVRATVAGGDGITGAELKSIVARLIAFTGFARNERTIAVADDYGELKGPTAGIGHIGDHTIEGVGRCLAACSEALLASDPAGMS